MLRADYRIVLSQRDLSSWLFLLHTWPLLSSSSIKRCAVEAWFCEETGTRGLISVAWRRGEESEGIYIFYFFPFLALHHTSWMCVKAGRYTALWWTECEKWARKNAEWWKDYKTEDVFVLIFKILDHINLWNHLIRWENDLLLYWKTTAFSR